MNSSDKLVFSKNPGGIRLILTESDYQNPRYISRAQYLLQYKHQSPISIISYLLEGSRHTFQDACNLFDFIIFQEGFSVIKNSPGLKNTVIEKLQEFIIDSKIKNEIDQMKILINYYNSLYLLLGFQEVKVY